MKKQMYDILEAQFNEVLNDMFKPEERKIPLKYFLMQAKQWLDDDNVDAAQFKVKFDVLVKPTRVLLCAKSETVSQLMLMQGYGYAAVACLDYALQKINALQDDQALQAKDDSECKM